MLDTEYVCTLSAKSLKKAKRELNEDPKDRLGAVQSLREWSQRENWITSPTDARFLVPFLRWSKFSQLTARERLTNFCSAFSESGQDRCLIGHDPGDPKSLEVFRHGVYTILPGTTKDGQAVLFGKLGASDIHNHSIEDYHRAVTPLLHSALFFSEEMQINGLSIIYDCAGLNMKHLAWIGKERLRNDAKRHGTIYPCRLGLCNLVNTGAVVETVGAIVRPFLSEKLRNRFQIHTSMESIYNEVDMSVLPSEYLPDDYSGPTAGSHNDIIESNIREYLLDPEKREYLKELYSGKYVADVKSKPSGVEPVASFRKLSI